MDTSNEYQIDISSLADWDTSESSNFEELFKDMYVPKDVMVVGLAKGYDLNEELKLIFERNIRKHGEDCPRRLLCIERDFRFELALLYEMETGFTVFDTINAKVYEEEGEIKFDLNSKLNIAVEKHMTKEEYHQYEIDDVRDKIKNHDALMDNLNEYNKKSRDAILERKKKWLKELEEGI